MFQSKFFPHLFGGERGPALFQTRFRQVTVFEVYNLRLDEFAGVLGFRASGLFRESRQAALNFRV